jgi:hypothetical protein
MCGLAAIDVRILLSPLSEAREEFLSEWSVEGFLLGYLGAPIPRSFRHGAKVPIVLTIEDQYGEVYSREVFLAVDRTAERGPKPGRRGQGGTRSTNGT